LLPKHKVVEPEYADPNFSLPKIPKYEPIAKPIEELNIVSEVKEKPLSSIIEVEIKEIEKNLDEKIIEIPILNNKSNTGKNIEKTAFYNKPKVEEKTEIQVSDNVSIEEKNTKTQVSNSTSIEEKNLEILILDSESIDEESTETPILDNETIKEGISKFSESLPISIRSLFKILPINTHDGQILIKANKQQFPQINDTKQKLQFFLRDYFKMETLQLLIEETDDVLLTDTKYTATEQFDDLIEIDTNFKYLVRKLKLNIKLN